MAGPGECEVWFYHLERSTLDQVLPELLDRTLAREWRALVRVRDRDLLEQLDDGLWTWRDDAFLAHGRADREHPDRQPILLTTETGNPNGAQALFIVDGADPGDLADFERCFVVFDGRDDASVAHARSLWARLKKTGGSLAYWKQTESGRWEKAA